MIEDKNKPSMAIYQREIRCPIHNCLLGKYDERNGVLNVTFFCKKCGKEYTYTIKANL